MRNYNPKSSQRESCFHIPQLHLQSSGPFTEWGIFLALFFYIFSYWQRTEIMFLYLRNFTSASPHPFLRKANKSTFLQWQWTHVRAIGYQIKGKSVIISVMPCIYSRAILLKKKLMNPLLHNIRQKLLSGVNKGKLPWKLQAIRHSCKRNSFPRFQKNTNRKLWEAL